MAYALITGGSKGIGKCIAQELAAKKYDLVLVARNINELEALSTQLCSQYGVQCLVLALDLSLLGSSQQVFNFCNNKKLPIEILVNNAGYGLSGPFESYTLAEHQKMLQVNVDTLVELSYLFLPQLKAQKASYILNIASTAAFQAVPNLSLYAASKVFVLNFSRGLNFELKGTPVSVTCSCPGGTNTNFSNRAQLKQKALKAGEKVNMTPEAVAKKSVAAMFAKKASTTTGFINKLNEFGSWILPKSLTEKIGAGLYTD